MQAQLDLWGCIGATLGFADVGVSAGAMSGTEGVCGFGVAGIAGARAEAAAVVQAWWVQAVAHKCKVWWEPAVWLL